MPELVRGDSQRLSAASDKAGIGNGLIESLAKAEGERIALGLVEAWG